MRFLWVDTSEVINLANVAKIEFDVDDLGRLEARVLYAVADTDPDAEFPGWLVSETFRGEDAQSIRRQMEGIT
jgi:hypothetical protein